MTVFYLIGSGVCLSLGVWLFRFGFDDMDTFLQEFGYRDDDHRSWQLIWTSLNDRWWMKLVFGVAGPYLIASVLMGLSLATWLG